ncbi:hypothetical protein Leryth_016680 [Lithospermum erythrorhizon]|nr:hypothetical protein Leryth_016680 [Lithospermum erythrorhizon]
MRDNNNSVDYDPLVVSFGPYHHGNPMLKFVEDFKPKTLQWFFQESGESERF